MNTLLCESLLKKMSQSCDNRMAISDLQGAVWNQIKFVSGDINTAVMFNRALCQLLSRSFNQVNESPRLITITSLHYALRKVVDLVGGRAFRKGFSIYQKYLTSSNQ